MTAADMGQGQPSAGLYEIPVAAQQTSGELYDVSKVRFPSFVPALVPCCTLFRSFLPIFAPVS